MGRKGRHLSWLDSTYGCPVSGVADVLLLLGISFSKVRVCPHTQMAPLSLSGIFQHTAFSICPVIFISVSNRLNVFGPIPYASQKPGLFLLCSSLGLQTLKQCPERTLSTTHFLNVCTMMDVCAPSPVYSVSAQSSNYLGR